MTTGNNNYNPYGQYGQPGSTNNTNNQPDYQQPYGAQGSYGTPAYGEQNGASTGYQQADYQSAASYQNGQVSGYGYGTQPNGYGYQMPYGSEESKPNGLGVASLVLGIVGFLLSIFAIGGIFALVGLVLGIIAFIQVKKTGGRKTIPIWGIAVSAVAVIISIGGLLFWMWIVGSEAACDQYPYDSAQYNKCVDEYFGVDSTSY